MVVRGVPDRLAKDGWWLDDADPPKGLRALPVLVGSLFMADWLVWGVSPGLGFAVWMVIVACATTLTLINRINARRLLIAFALLGIALLPLIEVVQFVTVVIAIFGVIGFSVIIATEHWEPESLLRAFIRVPGYGIVCTFNDLFAMRVAVPSKSGFRSMAFDWALPVIAGLIFLLLFGAANPVVDRWMTTLSQWNPHLLPRWERVFFWAFLTLAVWPLLRLTAFVPAQAFNKERTRLALRSGFLNERSVKRALITFNLIFLVQTALDLGYLWGGVTLPDGMTYAQYAHRGAYPLLATSLLAGLFALMAQPYLGKGAGVRALLYLWVAQTVLLVVSSILRLDLYVDVYGLTRLRFAAFIWMVVVALGLVLIIMQMAGRQSVSWFGLRAFGLGFLAIYLCSLINIDGYIARHNLADDHSNDHYLCQLGEGAVPAIRAHEAATGEELCYSYRPTMTYPQDWREWGYRNARLRRSLAAMEDAQ